MSTASEWDDSIGHETSILPNETGRWEMMPGPSFEFTGHGDEIGVDMADE